MGKTIGARSMSRAECAPKADVANRRRCGHRGRGSGRLRAVHVRSSTDCFGQATEPRARGGSLRVPRPKASFAAPMGRRTPLYEAHLAAGARMVEFSGWDMPVQYKGVLDEHAAVREKAGMFDVSHMGEVAIEGAGALEAGQR